MSSDSDKNFAMIKDAVRLWMHRKLFSLLNVRMKHVIRLRTLSRYLRYCFLLLFQVNLQELEENEDSTEIPPEILVPKYQAADLANEAAKLKSMEAMDSVPTDRLVKLLNLLQWNIRDGSKVAPIPSTNDDDDDEEDDDRLFLELAAERVSRAADCALCAMNIMTSKNMNKRVYIDDVIDKVAMFVRYQLQNTIYPSFDPVYKELSKVRNGFFYV